MRLLIFTIFIGLSLKSFGQSTVAANTGTVSRFLGWTDNTVDLDFKTNNFLRMKLNGAYGPGLMATYGIDGYNTWGNTNTTVNPTGYLLLGPDAPFQTQPTQTIYANRGAYSLLHLNGTAPIQQNGYRPWMKTGITFTDNADLSYFGLRQIGNTIDYTETVLTWSDNDGSSIQDDVAFRFTGTSTSSTTIESNFRNTSDLDGLHVARFTANGRFGLGNTFGHTNAPGHPLNLYVAPQSLLHMSYDHQIGLANQPYGFMQITYRRAPGTMVNHIGQGEAATDGLRLGIDNKVFNGAPQNFMNSYLRWQEASSFIIQTEDGGAPNIEKNERLRITSTGALDSNYTVFSYDGLRDSTNVTRISISESGAIPLERPKSLLHLGYDYGGLFNPGGVQGYRKWMDLGVLTSNNKDHVWIGLKSRDSLTKAVSRDNDKLDAVVAWGTDRQVSNPTQVDHMRFIFTGHTLESNPDLAPSTSYNGLEMMRMYPATVYHHPIFDNSGAQIDSTQSYGRVGVGDFTASGVNEEPTQKLDVVGNGRFRYLPDPAFARDSTVFKYVMVDSTGVLRWGLAPKGTACWDLNADGIDDSNEDINGDGQWNSLDCQGSTGAHNGTSISTIDPAKVSFGNDMGSTIGQLLSDREVPMNNHNIVFTNSATPSSTTNRIGIGTSAPTAKLDVQLVAGTTNIPDPTALNIVNNRSGSNGNAFGQLVKVTGTNNQNCGIQLDITAGTGSTTGIKSNIIGISPSSNNNVGLLGGVNVGGNPASNIGVWGSARAARVNIGGNFQAAGASNSIFNYGVNLNVDATGSAENAGVRIQTAGTGNTNYGILSRVISTSGTNLGVWSFITNPNTGVNRAGKFQGKLEATVPLIVTSDQQFKTNVIRMTGSLKQISSLKPVSYDMDIANFPDYGFDDKLQYGFIAQDVANVFPNLVYDSKFEAQYDSLGNVTDTAVNYKSLNYLGLIPVNTQAIIELNQKVDAISLSDESIKTNVQDLTGSLDKVLEMRGVSYDWDHTVHPEFNLDSVNQVGFIAQEIQQIDPRLTFIADDSLLHVKYEKVVPILAEAIEELNGQVESKDSIINILVNENSAQQNTIDDLNDRLTQLENCLSGILPFLCQLSHSAIQANTPEAQEEVRKNLNVTLSNRRAIVLDQNVPNPFAEQTVINFSIPETVKKAQIHFYDANGRFMNSVEVTERGLGSVTVFGSDLSTGVYSYSLVADGQVVATKKMMKQ